MTKEELEMLRIAHRAVKAADYSKKSNKALRECIKKAINVIGLLLTGLEQAEARIHCPCCVEEKILGILDTVSNNLHEFEMEAEKRNVRVNQLITASIMAMLTEALGY